jgi:Fic family protein
MRWNWQFTAWPEFRYESASLAARETAYLRSSGVVVGTTRHLPDDERFELIIELISTEALKTSEIEGDLLDRDSVQSSLRRQFGLQADTRRVGPAERGIAEMLSSVYRNFAAPLEEATLFDWHGVLMQAEAPPSARVPSEMRRFCEWFNSTAPDAPAALPALTRAGLAHLYFESIHPFEDGNGRIGRAIAEKALAQSAGQPTLTALSLVLLRQRSRYYRELELASASLEVSGWLDWFADRVIEAQAHTLAWLEFLIAKARLFDRLREKLNARQEKALLRLMREGPEGFKGGLSAGKYCTITGASPATARRDLAELVALGALLRTGERRGTRYVLMFAQPR